MIEHFMKNIEKSFDELKTDWNIEEVRKLDSQSASTLKECLDKAIKILQDLVPQEKDQDSSADLNAKFFNFCYLYETYLDAYNVLDSQDVISDYALDCLICLAELFSKMAKIVSSKMEQ